MRFVHDTLPQRVSFGSGEAAANLEHEIAALGASRVMVIAAKEESNIADGITGNLRVVLRYDDVVMHVPVEVAARAREAAATHNVDALVSVGGGSTTGLAKAIALTTGLPIVAVPTTYAGSEATTVWGLTEGNRKTTGTDPRVLPKVIVYDATLTLSLPVPMSVASGLNALAHSVDAMWAPKADPINAAFAAEGIRALTEGLPKVVTDPSGIDGREHALYAAYLSAVAFASACGAAPQDLPRARRRLQPAARPDARHRAALRAGLQRARGTGCRAQDRRRVRQQPGDRRPGRPAPRARRAAGAARLRLHRGRDPRCGRGDPARRPGEQSPPGDRRRPGTPAPRRMVRR